MLHQNEVKQCWVMLQAVLEAAQLVFRVVRTLTVVLSAATFAVIVYLAHSSDSCVQSCLKSPEEASDRASADVPREGITEGVTEDIVEEVTEGVTEATIQEIDFPIIPAIETELLREIQLAVVADCSLASLIDLAARAGVPLEALPYKGRRKAPVIEALQGVLREWGRV